MRPTLVRLVSEIVPTGTRPDATALLPPIPLYRRLFRAHRKHLPADMRVLGDEYVKAEFRAGRKISNPAHLIGFLTEWQLYAQKIEGDSWAGDKLEEGKLQNMSGRPHPPQASKSQDDVVLTRRGATTSTERPF
ncbi:hypothetical protein DCS_07909 [Drechmeria coniospora]|uniref:Succinate dehydrogenase assembly factor 3 n=1 Tax=Drechmeria coniospora TaxID=98403 RepID=A0A151GFT6_DRECN|nr:hypothetical protein DCS_07909 [Drechmeria coniospora]KYK55944.1 hypothetical protein DCS_07909 [Drechmeria coniospora]